MNAETEAADRKARLTPNKSVSIGALLRVYAELDAEREAHKATADALLDLAAAVAPDGNPDACEPFFRAPLRRAYDALLRARGVEAADAEA